jgi:hypothetical protein
LPKTSHRPSTDCLEREIKENNRGPMKTLETNESPAPHGSMMRGKDKTVKRVRIKRLPLSVSLPPELMERLDTEAQRDQRSRAQIVEFAIRGWLDRRA